MPKACKKANVSPVFRKGKEEDQELQTNQPYLSPWEASGANLSGNQSQIHERQEHNQEQSAQICEWEIMLNHPSTLLR